MWITDVDVAALDAPRVWISKTPDGEPTKTTTQGASITSAYVKSVPLLDAVTAIWLRDMMNPRQPKWMDETFGPLPAFPPINVPFIVEGARFKLNPRFIGLGPSPSDMFMAFDANGIYQVTGSILDGDEITAEKYPYDIMILLKTKCGAAPVLHEEGEFVMISPRGNVSHI